MSHTKSNTSADPSHDFAFCVIGERNLSFNELCAIARTLDCDLASLTLGLLCRSGINSSRAFPAALIIRNTQSHEGFVKTGRGTDLTKQPGEYLVAAELSRRGYITTTFTGNLPCYDIIAVDDCGGHVVVQVKAIAGKSWQFKATDFADIAMHGRQQIIRCERQ
jgi:hypothetical protein